MKLTDKVLRRLILETLLEESNEDDHYENLKRQFDSLKSKPNLTNSEIETLENLLDQMQKHSLVKFNPSNLGKEKEQSKKDFRGAISRRDMIRNSVLGTAGAMYAGSLGTSQNSPAFLEAVSHFHNYIDGLRNRYPNMDIDDLLDAGYEFAETVGFTQDTQHLEDQLTDEDYDELMKYVTNSSNY